MTSERVRQALGRIDTAFSRVETALAARRAESGAAPALVERNMRLTETLVETLDEIDALIRRAGG